MNTIQTDLKDKLMIALDNFLNINDQITFKNVKICLMNPLDIVNLDLQMFSKNCYFISDLLVNQNSAILLDDNDEEKKYFWDFIKKFPDRVFQGKKEINNYVC